LHFKKNADDEKRQMPENQRKELMKKTNFFEKNV